MIQLHVALLLLCIFVLYHAVQWLGRRRDASECEVPHNDNVTFSVSFLVPGWNAQDSIPRFIESFYTLHSIQNKQLILCVGGDDESYSVAKSYESSNVVVLPQRAGMGKQKALNASLPYATGDVIYLTDIDCELRNDMVTRLLAQLQPNRSVVTGGIQPTLADAQNPFVKLQWAIRKCASPVTVTVTNGMLGANSALWRSTLESVGGFAVEVRSGTDYTLAKELMAHGHKIWFVPNCEMITEFPETIRIYIHKQTRWLRNILILGPKYRDWSEIRSVAVTILLPYVYLALLLVGCLVPVFWMVFVLMLLHATISRLRYISGWKYKVSMRIVLLSVFADLAASGMASYQWLVKKQVW